MGAQVIESAGAFVPARLAVLDPNSGHQQNISGRSSTAASFATAIRADIGEAEGYKQALLRGEIGLQRPFGVNVRGVDFITAIRSGSSGIAEVVCTDVKTSGVGRFPAPKTTLPGAWLVEVRNALSTHRLKLEVRTTDVTGTSAPSFPIPRSPAELAVLAAGIVEAVRQNRIRLRQLNANYSPAGQGQITGW